MLTLLLGPDDFSKKEYIGSLAAGTKSEVRVFFDAEDLPSVESLIGQDLFGGAKIFVLKGLVAHFNNAMVLEKLVASKNQIIIIEEKLDKRLVANKALLARKDVKVEEFILPHGKELDKWIIARAKSIGGSINAKAADALAIALGRDDAKETKFGGKVTSVEEVYNLWQAENELKKLVALSNGQEISEADVKELAPSNREVDVFDLTNAIADNQKQKALSLMQDFLFFQTGSDEKGSIIKLNALLSEQFRNVAVVQSFASSKTSEDAILEKTGWKSGRLFIMKKTAARFTPKTVLELLNKLASLDEELKTSSTPPRVLLDLIISQLFA
jgi:DNA polymerase III delta subunit